MNDNNNDSMLQFKIESNNVDFKVTPMTWVSMFLLLIGYPIMQLLGAGEESLNLLKNMNQGTLMFMLIATVVFLWMIFMVNYVSTYTEGTGLAGVGLVPIRGVDFLWAGSFLLAANLALTGVAWVLARIGMPLSGDLALLVPTDTSGKILWVFVSFTAGFCEEIAFRGYLMTRLRLLGKFNSWLIPTVVSAITFGICHAYQGWPGLILISIYGLFFSLLYIRVRTLWPLIIAHFFQDFSHLFFPMQ